MSANPPILDNPSAGTPADEWAHRTLGTIPKGTLEGAATERPNPVGEGQMPTASKTEVPTNTTPAAAPPTTPAAPLNADTTKSAPLTEAAPPGIVCMGDVCFPAISGPLGTFAQTSARVQPASTLPVDAHAPSMQRTDTNMTTGTLPGNQFPGAFPRGNSDYGAQAGSADLDAVLATAQETLGQVAATAQDTLGKAATTAAAYLPASMQQTVKQYLPAGAAATAGSNDISHTTSLPSAELAGQLPGERVEGAGALPGRSTEQGVAEPPQAPPTTAETSTTQDYATTAKDIVAGAAVGTSLAAGAAVGTVAGAATLAKDRIVDAAYGSKPDNSAVTSLPSQELAGLEPGEKTSGVGALPGTAGEKGVAVLPDEKSTAGTGGVGELPGKANESNVALLPDEKNDLAATSNKPTPPTPAVDAAPAPPSKETVGASDAASATPVGEKQQERSMGDVKGLKEGDDTKVHGGAGPLPAGSLSAGAPKPEKKGSDPASPALSKSGKSKSREGSPAPGSPGKSSFMNKIKGEVKIISGKLGKNPEKVEEGMRMKSGGTTQ